MAKRGALDNPKTKRLARGLGTFPGIALGLLETLFHWVAEYRPDGGVTRADIEDALDSGGWLSMFNAAQVIDAMTDTDRECVWLDSLEGGRYYIHDWHEHCEDNVNRKLAREKRYFANGVEPSLSRLAGKERLDLEAFYSERRVITCAQNAIPGAPSADMGARESTQTNEKSTECAQSSTSCAPSAPCQGHGLGHGLSQGQSLSQGQYMRESSRNLGHPPGQPPDPLLEFPPGFRSEKLSEAWGAFKRDRGHRNLTAYTPTALQRVLIACETAKLGPDDLAEIIDTAISSAWRGIPASYVRQFAIKKKSPSKAKETSRDAFLRLQEETAHLE